jgi:hypothetical protein
MKNLLLAATGLSFCLAANTGRSSEWSLVERGYIKAIPPLYAKHTSGFVTDPTDQDVQDAIEFGKTCKEKPEPLQYAYIFKSSSGFFSNDSIYVELDSPLALIAKHAQAQAQEYRSVDRAYIAFVRKLKAVRLSISQQRISTKTWSTLVAKRQLILLRDGERIETVNEIPAWHGGNPFPREGQGNKQLQAKVASAQKNVLVSMRPFFASNSDSMKRTLLESYRMTGIDDQTLAAGLGISAEEFQRLISDGTTSENAKYSLSESDSVYSMQELNIPGKYEVVFREPQVGMLGGVSEKEIRFPITFNCYR